MAIHAICLLTVSLTVGGRYLLIEVDELKPGARSILVKGRSINSRSIGNKGKTFV